MVENITAANHYELIKLLGILIDPKEFSHGQGWVHFKIKEVEPGVFCFKKYDQVYDGDEWDFACAAASEGLFYGFVCRDPFETTLGIRAPKMMAEYLLVDNQWSLIEMDDFDLRKESVAWRRFEISKDFYELKKFLAKS